MRIWSLIFAIAAIVALQPFAVYAAEDKADWRARAAVADRDTYSDSDTNEELNFGREIAARLLGQYKMSGDQKLQKYVNLVGTTLTQNCTRPELTFHFIVVESSEINAYSTPGGYVLITTAVLAQMENEAELAGVLAHEISHVTERHIVKELSLKGAEKSAVTSIAALIGGASESVGIAFSQAVDKAVDIILRDGYKKEDEMQADANAVLLSAFSGYDPSGLVTFLNKVGTLKEDVGKTYPVYDVRLATLQKSMTDGGIAGMKLALNTERFVAATKKPKNSTNPLNIIRKVIPGGTPR
jgi:predicted Zn-dependent protease